MFRVLATGRENGRAWATLPALAAGYFLLGWGGVAWANEAAPAQGAKVDSAPSSAGAVEGETLRDKLTIARFSAEPPNLPDSPTAVAIRRAFAGRGLTDQVKGDADLPQKPRSGVVGYVLADTARGAVLERRNADERLIPASVAKAPTALYALDALGPDFTFKTRVTATGPIANGVLKGDLYLVGGGDPALDSKDLRSLARQLKAAGLKKVEGRFIYDESAIAPMDSILSTQPVQARYNPGVSGLNLNFNQVRVEWERQKDESYVFKASSAVRGLSTPSNLVTVSAAPHDTIKQGGFDWRLAPPRKDGEEPVETWRISSRFLGRKGGRGLPVRRPGAFAADAFREIARNEGITLPVGKPGVAPTTATELAVHESGRLEAILRGMLRFSTNITAEVVGLMTSRARGLEEMSLERSSALMSAWASTRFGGEGGAAATAFKNHSGLSLESRLTARSMTEILVEAGRPTAVYDKFFDLLPRYRVKGLPKKAQVRAKTGTVHYGRGLAGYLECPSGKRLAFSYFNSDIETRAKFDQSQNRGQYATRAWLGRARSIEKKLLARWSKDYC